MKGVASTGDFRDLLSRLGFEPYGVHDSRMRTLWWVKDPWSVECWRGLSGGVSEVRVYGLGCTDLEDTPAPVTINAREWTMLLVFDTHSMTDDLLAILSALGDEIMMPILVGLPLAKNVIRYWARYCAGSGLA